MRPAIPTPLSIYKSLNATYTKAYGKTSKVIGNWDWVWPAPGVTALSSCYVDVPGHSNAHYGIDIASSAANKEIVAAYAGTVIVATNSNATTGYGTRVVLEHTYNGKKYRSLYGHMKNNSIPKEIIDIIGKGKEVPAGTKLGIMGNTGDSGGQHLHFSVWEGKTASTPKDASLVVDPFLNHFLPVPANMIKGDHYPNNAYTGEGQNLLSKPKGKSWCCEYYLDAVKWEWEKNRGNTTTTTTTTAKSTTSTTKAKCTVTLNPNGGTVSPSSYTVDAGSSLTLPTPKKAGYTFVGWYTSSGSKLSSTVTVNGSATLTAQWTAIPTATPTTTKAKRTVTLNPNGGTLSPSSYTVDAGSSLTLPTPKKAGYAFAGWYLNGNKMSTTVTVNNSATLTAQWTAIPTSTTTNVATQSISITSATPNRTSGTTTDKYAYTITTNIPATKVEFVFSGNSKVFYVNSNGTNNLNAGSIQFSNGGKTLQWSTRSVSETEQSLLRPITERRNPHRNRLIYLFLLRLRKHKQSTPLHST